MKKSIGVIFGVVVMFVIGGWRAYEATRTREIWEEPQIRLSFRMQGKGIDYSWVAHGQRDGRATFEATLVAPTMQRQSGTLGFEQWTKLLHDTVGSFDRMSGARADGKVFQPGTTFVISLESEKRKLQEVARNDPQATPLLETIDASVALDPLRAWTKRAP